MAENQQTRQNDQASGKRISGHKGDLTTEMEIDKELNNGEKREIRNGLNGFFNLYFTI
jgi:hypothetical protein